MNRKLFNFGKKKASSSNDLSTSNLRLQPQDEARGLNPFLATNDQYLEALKRQRYESVNPEIEATTDYQKALSFLEMAEYCPCGDVIRGALNAIDRIIAGGNSF